MTVSEWVSKVAKDNGVDVEQIRKKIDAHKKDKKDSPKQRKGAGSRC